MISLPVAVHRLTLRQQTQPQTSLGVAIVPMHTAVVSHSASFWPLLKEKHLGANDEFNLT